MKKFHVVVCLLLFAIAIFASVVCYPALPLSVPIHWSINGQPNAYGPRAAAAALGPALMSFFLVIGLFLPRLSSRYRGPGSFQMTFSYFVAVLVFALGFFHAAILHALVTGTEELTRPFLMGLCVLLILVGNPMGKVKRNMFVGVRITPTLASTHVWHATQRMGARLMVGSGLLGLLTLAAKAPLWLPLLLIGAWTVLIVLYALFISKRFTDAGQS